MTAQQEAIAALGNPEFHDPPVDRVEIVETHGAMVFLAGGRAYKIKKAVRFDYMDFSTLEKRRAACRRELALNRPGAPQIYIDVVPLTRNGSGLRLGGDGEVCEWVVVMNRFAQDALLSQVCRQDRLTTALLDDLAGAVRRHHDAAPADRSVDWAERLAGILAGVSSGLAGFRERLPAAAAAGRFETAARQHLDRLRPCLGRRGRRGRIRRCHGDLHLDNIVLIDGKPVLFDALEFDDDLATIDVLYDVAFLLMDLDRLGRPDAASTLFNRYMQAAPPADLAALGAMPLFVALRAAIRAMVRLQRACATDRDGSGEARDYLNTALAALTAPPPRLIAVGGLSGTGKSTLAAALAPGVGTAPGALHLRSDVERKLSFAVAPTERLGPDAYTPEASRRVYRRLLRKAFLALGSGYPAIVDAVFARHDEQHRIERVAARAGLAFHGLWLEAGTDAMLARVATRRGDASDATAQVVMKQMEFVEPPSGWTRIDASGTAANTLRLARTACGMA